MGFKKNGQLLGFADFALASSLKHNRSLKFTPLNSVGAFIWGGIQYLKGIENLKAGQRIGWKPQYDLPNLRGRQINADLHRS